MNKNIMKKILSAVFLFSLSVSSLFAIEDSIFSFDAGLSSGVTVYGDNDIRKANSSVKNNGHRVALGTVCDVNVRISDYLTFFLGNDSFFDLAWKGDYYSNHIETAFFPGLKVYPGLGGFNFSCAYSAGTRWDFLSMPVETDEDGNEIPFKTDPVSWGNGFRLGLEYNFSYDSNPLYPSVGFYYRLCPRGNYNWDNVFAVYVLANF